MKSEQDLLKHEPQFSSDSPSSFCFSYLFQEIVTGCNEIIKLDHKIFKKPRRAPVLSLLQIPAGCPRVLFQLICG